MHERHNEHPWKPSLGPSVVQEVRSPSPRHWSAGNEVILTAATGRFDDHGEATVTLRCNEPGVADFGRLLVSSLAPSQGYGAVIRYDELARVESILLFNSHQKIRGLPYPEAPAGPLSPVRRQRSIDLGKVRLAVGDTVAITLRFRSERPQGVTAAVPFQPDAVRRLGRNLGEVREPHVVLAAPAKHGSGQGPVDVTLTLEEDGVVDLGSLQLFGSFAPGVEHSPENALAASVIESIRLPSAEDLLVGNLDPDTHDPWGYRLAVPATVFDPEERMGPWFRLGPLSVLRGQRITVRLSPCLAEVGIPAGTVCYSAAMSFYPSLAEAGQVTPSNLFGPWSRASG